MAAFLWYEDPRGLEGAAQAASLRAVAGDWTSKGAAPDLVALAVSSTWTAAALAGVLPKAKGDAYVIDQPIPTIASAYPSDVHKRAVDALMQTQANAVVRAGKAPSAPPSSDLHYGGAGAAPAVIIGVAAIAAIGLSVMTYFVADRAAAVVDRQNSREENSRRMWSLQAQAAQVCRLHLERERIAGTPLPWSPGEIAAVAMLEAQNAVVLEQIKKEPKPLEPSTSGDWIVPAAIVGGVLVFGNHLLSGGKAA